MSPREIHVFRVVSLLSVLGIPSLAFTQEVSEAWVARYDGPGSAWDRAVAVAVDTEGNVYVTGHSEGSGTGLDHATVKYSPEGEELWVARYDGPTGADRSAVGLAVDSDGNAYVTGRFLNSGQRWACATVKYSPEGEELWVAHWAGTYACAVGLDSESNFYVTGTSEEDYATMKYSPEGEELWVARYDGPRWPRREWANALAVDSEGNVYVTGESVGDYATVKYSSEGEELWVARYAQGEDEAIALAVDSEGNVYVTGHSEGPGTLWDYATVKYSPEGEELWVARYDGGRDESPVALAVDSEGNVYVTGESEISGTGEDYETVKYSPAGEELWVARYNGLGGGRDYVRALGLDSEGNVYVTGGSWGGPPDEGGTYSDYATVKYSPAGKELWVARYDGRAVGSDFAGALALDNEANVYVTGASEGMDTGEDYATVKYSSAGEELWAARYNGAPGGDEYACALALDSEGNVYVAGESERSNRDADYATAKYSPEGEELWVARLNHGEYWDGSACAVTLDSEGNVYVTGSTYANMDRDYVTAKYSSEGEELWVRHYDGDGNTDSAVALAVDSEGNVYVTGESEDFVWPGPLADVGYATVKYSPAGEELWVARYDGGVGWNHAVAVALDSEGNVYVAGTSDLDYATVKYSPAGEELWVASYDGPEGGGAVYGLAVDSEGNVYVAGTSGLDYATVKYSPGGEELWVRHYDGDENADSAVAVAVDSEGNVYVTGESESLDRHADYATVKYSSAGEELWVARYDGGRNDSAVALAVDSEGNVYVTGESESLDRYVDYATVKYSPAGEELWVERYDGPASKSDSACALALDSEGSVYVTGTSQGDYATIKYSQGFPILPSDCNADGTVDISDSIALLGHLFLGDPRELPCGDGTLRDSGNLRLVDANGDGAVDLSDGIYVLSFLFLGSPAPVLGTDCVPMAGCPDACTL